MPLVRLDVPDHLDPVRVAGLAEAVQAALVATAGVPAADRFQFVHRHAAPDRIVDASFPDLNRSRDAVVISIIFRRGRSDDQKRALYRAIAEGAAERAGLAADDVMVVLTENGPADWSFGRGLATYAPA